MTTNLPAHLTPERSNRGFAYLPALPATYGGEISVYESSAADGPHLWIRAKGGEGKFAEGQEVALHFDAETAWRFAEQIIASVQGHYQGDATPEDAAYEVVRHG